MHTHLAVTPQQVARRFAPLPLVVQSKSDLRRGDEHGELDKEEQKSGLAEEEQLLAGQVLRLRLLLPPFIPEQRNANNRNGNGQISSR